MIRKAIEEPLRWIATNAGQEGSIVVARVKEAKNAGEGYNAATDKYEDMVAAGVIDPTKVVRSALQNASSIASLLLTTEALVSEIPEEKKECAGGGMPGGGGGMGGMYVLMLRLQLRISPEQRRRADWRLLIADWRMTNGPAGGIPAGLFYVRVQVLSLRIEERRASRRERTIAA